jgi:hypothetical protein
MLKTVFRLISLALQLGTSLMFFAIIVMAQQPTIVNGADGSGQAAFWYLGGLPSCCADSAAAGVGAYYTQAQLLASIQPGCSETPSWTTDSPQMVAIAPNPGGLSAILTSSAPSYTTKQTTVQYNIHIYVTACGMQSPPFPVFINTPISFSDAAQGVLCNAYGCNCNANPSNQARGITQGYLGWDLNSGGDLVGNTLVKIDLHELLGIYWDPGVNWGNYVTPPQPSGWPATTWYNTTAWADELGVCVTPGTPMNPLIWSWGAYPPGTTYVGVSIQSFLVGTTQINGQGACITGNNNVQWYTGYANVIAGTPPCGQ